MKIVGRVLSAESQQMVLNVIEYFVKEKENGGPLQSVVSVRQRVAAALKISEATISRIVSRQKNGTPPKNKITRCRQKSKSEDVCEAVKVEIRNTIYEMHLRKEHITLSTLLAAVRDKKLFNGRRTSLHLLIKSIGFSFKSQCNRRALCEKSHVVSMRTEFLRSYIKNLNTPSPLKIVYLDETWIFARGSAKRTWQDNSPKSVKNDKPEGKRYIVLHGGTSEGFVDKAGLLFSTKNKSADYHDNMSAEMFEKWLEFQLLPTLEEPSIIILDNASYHSRLILKQPASNWKKCEIEEWLQNRGISYAKDLLKNEMLILAKQNKVVHKYAVDEIIHRNGHQVLRLPPYHCQFNAIELVWGIVKNYYDRHIGRDGYGDDCVLKMWQEALNQVTPEIWKKCVSHTESLIKDWWSREKVMDEVNPLIIDLASDSEDDSDTNFEESDKEN